MTDTSFRKVLCFLSRLDKHDCVYILLFIRRLNDHKLVRKIKSITYVCTFLQSLVYQADT